MRQLTVSVAGQDSEDKILAVPFDVYGPEGEPLASGTASPRTPKIVPLGNAANFMSRVHVVALLPSGERVQEAVELQGATPTVTLRVGQSSPHEWLQWVTPFRSLEHLRPEYTTHSTRPPRKIGQVWLTLWRLNEGRWTAADLTPMAQMRDTGMRQVSLDLPEAPHLLQIGGDEVAWRLVSLPPGGAVRVAMTRRAANDGDSIDLTVGRQRPVNELVMDYLSSGATVEAARLAKAWHAADLMLFEKERDPVSAAAGAYLLLKLNRLDARRRWVDNLVDWFPYLADGPIVAAALALQRDDVALNVVRRHIDLAISRGLPVFGLGMSILVETMAAVHRGKKETKRFQLAYQATRAYLQARSPRGAYFAFYGRSPAEPSWNKLYGGPDNGLASPARLEGSDGPEVPLRVGTHAPGLERSLRKITNTSSTDDLLRLGLAKQYRLPSAAALQRYEELWAKGQRTSIEPASRSTDDWNIQRKRSAFMVFDGDE
jgi:hypothetical protein